MHYFLGIQVIHTADGIILNQQKFTKEIITEAGIDCTRTTCTPLPVHLKLSHSDGTLITNPESYRSLVGKLNYLTNSRPDLSYTVQALSQYMHAPGDTHLAALHHTIRYLAGTIH